MTQQQPSAQPSAESASLPVLPTLPAEVRFLAVGGGADPASNQVSMEQDLALAQTSLGPGGVLLFAGGLGHSPVQVQAPDSGDPPLELRLGELFAHRDGRSARYRQTLLAPHAPATRASFEHHLQRALARGQDPLLVFVAGHGEGGDQPGDNRVLFWGDEPLYVDELAKLLDAQPARPLRLVLASCFSGGFAELAFRDADADAGAPPGERCGLFASTWDREASGCDPNPDRRAQEGYGIHFLNALRGRDRAGAALDRAELDLDGDGAVGLLEAHTRVRVASLAFSVPTTTSERWLRQHAPASGPAKPLELPEEQHVVSQLGARLKLVSAQEASARYAELEAETQRRAQQVLEQEQKLGAVWGALRIALLQRWPVLDDPYHPDYRTTLERERKPIQDFLNTAPEATAFARERDLLDQQAAELDREDVASAQVLRLVRAHENLALVARLNAAGGPALARYQELLACERSPWSNGEPR